MIMIYILQH